jgi:hypothetical protein
MRSRLLVFLGLFQTACLVMGFFALGIILKVAGYPEGDPMIRWSPIAVFLRTQGLWLLVVPALWVCFAVYSSTRGKGVFSEGASVVAGIGISAAIILTFLYAAIFPFSRIALVVP